MNQKYFKYNVELASVSQRLLSVSLTIPALDESELVLSLPAWIPGSYMIRDFAKNIVSFEAVDENQRELNVSKLDKQRWRVNTNGVGCTISCSVYANDLSVRSAFINDDWLFFNGTSTFLQVEGYQHVPCYVELSKSLSPHADGIIETTLPQYRAAKEDGEDSQAHHYLAQNYAELIDHPVFAGAAMVAKQEVEGVEFRLVLSGECEIDIERIMRDLVPICRHHLQFFGKPYPIKEYSFITMLSQDGFGGLEHRSSTALLFPRFDLPLRGEAALKSESYINFLSLCSHELFHTWHVKRSKPKVMVEPDVLNEVYTPQLWIYEGFTSFYDDLTVARTGLINASQYLDILAKNMTRVHNNPGRHKQSVTESSFDAWTRFYKQDAYSVNHIVSYYTKGGLIAMALDIWLRQHSGDKYNLDLLMEHLWRDYGEQELGTPDEVISELCDAHFNLDISNFIERYVTGTEDAPLAELLPHIGVEVITRAALSLNDKGGKVAPLTLANQKAFGASIKAHSVGVTVTQVLENSPACKASLFVNDNLIAVDGWQVSESNLQRLLNAASNETITLTVLRDGRLLTLAMPSQDAQETHIELKLVDETKFLNWLQVSG